MRCFEGTQMGERRLKNRGPCWLFKDSGGWRIASVSRQHFAGATIAYEWHYQQLRYSS